MKDWTIRGVGMGLAGLACLALAACSGGADAEPDLEEVAVTESDLPEMALQVGFVEIDGVRLTLDPEESGPMSRDEILKDSWDPEEDAADLEEFGWQAHHDQTFLGSPLLPHPVFFACTGLSLYSTHDGASRDLSDALQEAMDQIGTTSPNGVRLVDASPFEVPGLDGAVGLKMTGQVDSGEVYHSTMVAFVRGRVMGIVQVASLDERDLSAEAENMAGDLERQIAIVLEG